MDDAIRQICQDEFEKCIMEKIVPKAKEIAQRQIKNQSSGKGQWSKGTLVGSISGEITGYLHAQVGTHGVEYASYVDEGRGALPKAPTKNGKKWYTDGDKFWSKGPIKATKGAGILKAWESELKGV